MNYLKIKRLFIILVFLFGLIILLYPLTTKKFFVKAIGENELPNLCQGGMYDFCSQAPQCGEYANLRWENGNYPQEWLDKSRELWNRYGKLFTTYCWGYDYSTCQGYVPLCCYEMVRLNDPHMCNGYDPLYCLPKQCQQVRDSSSVNCGYGAKYYAERRCPNVNISNLDPIPLSRRYPNDVLCNLYKNLTASQKQTICSQSPENEVCQFCEELFKLTPTSPAITPTGSPTTTVISPTNPISPTLSETCSKKNRGDANCDGNINELDYQIWRCEYLGEGTCLTLGTYKTADFDRNNLINLVDAEIWRKNKQ